MAAPSPAASSMPSSAWGSFEGGTRAIQVHPASGGVDALEVEELEEAEGRDGDGDGEALEKSLSFGTTQQRALRVMMKTGEKKMANRRTSEVYMDAPSFSKRKLTRLNTGWLHRDAPNGSAANSSFSFSDPANTMYELFVKAKEQIVKARRPKVKSKHALVLTGARYARWDIAVATAAVVCSIMAPYEAAFLDLDTVGFAFFLNRLVDAVYAVDVVLNFFLAYPEKKTAYETELVYDLGYIRQHYAQTWFVPDVAAALPLDLLLHGGDLSGSARNAILGTRVVRLVKLFHVGRRERLFKRLENSVELDYNSFDLVCFVILAVISSHWMACLFAYVARVEGANDNWYVARWPAPDGSELWTAADVEATTTSFERWLVSFYWATMTITTIGYGDVAPSSSKAELAVVCLCMLLGGFQFGYLLSSVANILEAMNRKNARFRETLSDLNLLMSDGSFSPDLRRRLRDYFLFKQSLPDHSRWRHLLEAMSPALRGSTARAMEQMMIEQVPLFAGCSTPCLVELKMHFKLLAYPRSEIITRVGSANDHIFVVKTGFVAIGDADGVDKTSAMIKGKGSVLCESALYKDGLVHNYRLTSLSMVAMYALDRETMLSILHRFPDERKMMRRRAISRLFREEALAYVAAISYFDKNKERRRVGTPITPRVLFYYNKLRLLHQESIEKELRLQGLVRVVQRQIRSMLAFKRKNGTLRSQQPVAPKMEDVPQLAATVLRQTSGVKEAMEGIQRQLQSLASNAPAIGASSNPTDPTTTDALVERLNALEAGQARIELALGQVLRTFSSAPHTTPS